MKLLKNLGWFLLAVVSFFFGYGLVQSMALSALGLGASIFGVLPLISSCQGPMFMEFTDGIRQKRLASRRRLLIVISGCQHWFC